MKKKAIIILLAFLTLLVYCLYTFSLKNFMLIPVTETRYLRSDLQLGKTPTDNNVYVSSEPISAVYIYLYARIYWGETLIKGFYLTDRFASTGDSIAYLFQHPLEVNEVTVENPASIILEICWIPYGGLSITPIVRFQTEIISAKTVGGNTWYLSLHYYRGKGSSPVEIHFGTSYEKLENIKYNLEVPEPTADFTYLPKVVYEGDEVTFDASNSKGAKEYYWSISFQSKTIFNCSSFNPILKYIFNEKGVYNITLTVKNEYNLTNTTSKTLNVNPNLLYSLSFSGKLYTYTEIIFTANVNLKYTVNTFIWNFGDGNTTTTTENIITHYYKAKGAYNITVQAKDFYGNVDTANLILNIAETKYNVYLLENVKPLDDGDITLKVIKNSEAYVYALLKIYYDNNYLTDVETDSSGLAYFVIPEQLRKRGVHTVSVYDLKFKVEIGAVELTFLTKVYLQLNCESQQFYNIIGENDFSLTVIVLDPDTNSKVLNFKVYAILTSEQKAVPSDVVIVDNRVIVTAKIFKFFNDTKSRLVYADIKVEAEGYCPTSISTVVKMVPPTIDYFLCDVNGNSLPRTINKGLSGFTIKLVKPEYLNISKENIMLTINSPSGTLTRENLNFEILSNTIYVHYEFNEVGTYIITVSFNLPVYVPTRTYTYIVEEQQGIQTFFSENVKYIFFIIVFLAFIYLIRRKRE